MKCRWLATLMTIALLFLGSGCSYRLVEPSWAAGAIQKKQETSPKDLFSGHPGTFVLRDLSSQATTIVNEQQANKRVSPLSTFTIFNALAALDTGVLQDETTGKKWDGTNYAVEVWNRDQSLSTAMANSVDWFFEDTAQAVGEERMESYILRAGYGNAHSSGAANNNEAANSSAVASTSPQNGSLQISAMEQVAFLEKLYKEELPFKKSAMSTVKKILTIQSGDHFTYAGKTGSSSNLGWFVGYVTTNDKTYVFATNIEGNKDVDGSLAREITEEILREMQILPVAR